MFTHGNADKEAHKRAPSVYTAFHSLLNPL